MTHEEQLKIPSHWNWLRAQKADKYLKHGIRIFVDKCVKDVQNTFLQDIGNNLSLGIAFCDGCTTKNVIPCPTYGICNVSRRGGICNYHDKNDPPQRYRKCPNNVCDRLCEKIQDHHRYRKPTWKNTDASMWCKNHWKIAKCFLPYDNYGEMTSASKTCCSDLLNVIVNCLPIQNRLNVVINPPHDIVSKIIKAGKAILHSRKLELTNQNIHEYIDGMITLLQDTKLLDKDPDAILAVEKLEQLKSDKQVISTYGSIGILGIPKQALSAIAGKKKVIEDKEAKNTELSGLQKENASTRCKRIEGGASPYPSSPLKRTKDSALNGTIKTANESLTSSIETSATQDQKSFQTVESASRQSTRKRRSASTYQRLPLKRTKASRQSTRKWRGLTYQSSLPKGTKDSWETCLKKHSEEMAQQLLKSNNLPSEKELKQAWGLWGNSNPVLIEKICKSISDKIFKMSESIVSVCPTYNAKTRDNEVFVVVSSSPIDVKIKHPVMHRLSGEYNEEGKKVSAFVATSNRYSGFSAQELHKCIENNLKRLLEDQSNITIIASCPVKSTNYLSDKENAIKEDKCAVLYVPVKGQIPINEKPFDEDLDDIPIDVREGGFEFCSNDRHKLQMGCRIVVPSSSGSLGPFVDYKNHTCFLTSAHVVFNSSELHDLKTKKTIEWDHMEGPRVYHISTDTENNVHIGNVIRAEHRCGGDGRAGVEVAVAAAYSRQPQCGNCNFPDENNDSALNGTIKTANESLTISIETSATQDQKSFQTVESASRQSTRKRRSASTYQRLPLKRTKASRQSTSKWRGLTYQSSLSLPGSQETDDSWATCLKKHSEEMAQQLLKSNNLPSEKELKQAWGLWGDSNPVLIEKICKSISDKIFKMSESIVSVCPTYNAKTRDNVVFVVVSSSPIDVKIKHPVMHRLSGEYNEEGKKVSAFVATSNSYSRLSAQDKYELHKCIENNSKRLLKNHSNITIIASCPVKSTNYLSDKENAMKEDKCVVLYVPVKGQIPINEKPFDEDLDGIPIDVREGGFEFCNNDKHMLQMGCRIEVPSSSGTLGPFVDYKNHTCFLTSAHVVFNSSELHDLKTEKTIEWDHMEGPRVYHICTDTENNVHIGNVIRAEYRCGGDGKAGVEVAVVAAYSRQPQCGNCNFPDEDNGIQKATYLSGQICFPSQFQDSLVVMFGSSSKQSNGYFRSNDAVIRKRMTIGEKDWSIELHNQIIIDSADTQNEFGQLGDSGSLVFVAFGDDKSDLRAFGIFEGKLSDGKYIVTPINDILEVLQHPKMKEFSENVNKITEMQKEIQLLKTEMASNHDRIYRK